jgi:hypothetical protein
LPALRSLLPRAPRSPASDERDPAAYSFTDTFLLEAVGDFESREEMWAVLGRDNEGVVKRVITAAAQVDRRFCAQLQSLALLCRARRLLAAAAAGSDPLPAQQLAELLQEEQALALARDMEGRSLWHDLAAGEHLALLRALLPIAAEAGFAASAGPQGEQPASNGGCTDQQQEQEATDNQQQDDSSRGHTNCLNLPNAAGSTPLHLAAEASALEVARLLLDHGADSNAQNRWADASRTCASTARRLHLNADPHAAAPPSMLLILM